MLDFSRLGDRGEWTMQLGGGLFGEWQSSAARLEKIEIDKPEFKTAVYDALKTAGKPLGQDKLLAAVRERGVRAKSTTARALLMEWVANREEPLRSARGGGYECDA